LLQFRGGLHDPLAPLLDLHLQGAEPAFVLRLGVLDLGLALPPDLLALEPQLSLDPLLVPVEFRLRIAPGVPVLRFDLRLPGLDRPGREFEHFIHGPAKQSRVVAVALVSGIVKVCFEILAHALCSLLSSQSYWAFSIIAAMRSIARTVTR